MANCVSGRRILGGVSVVIGMGRVDRVGTKVWYIYGFVFYK